MDDLLHRLRHDMVSFHSLTLPMIFPSFFSKKKQINNSIAFDSNQIGIFISEGYNKTEGSLSGSRSVAGTFPAAGYLFSCPSSSGSNAYCSFYDVTALYKHSRKTASWTGSISLLNAARHCIQIQIYGRKSRLSIDFTIDPPDFTRPIDLMKMMQLSKIPNGREKVSPHR